MNKTELQHSIQQRQVRETQATNTWLKQNGLNADTFATTHVPLLQAQKAAHEAMTKHRQHLTDKDMKKLQAFERKMRQAHIRKKLPKHAANPIFQICTKAKRQAHKQQAH
jgi:hypothetical protein